MKFKTFYLHTGIALAFLSFSDVVPALAVRHEGTLQQHKDLALEHPSIAVFGRGDGAGLPIADRWVITAAHVAESLPHTGNSLTYAGRAFEVANIYLHPQWSPVNHYDLALVELTAAIPDLTPVRLSTGQESVGQQVLFIGAGDFAKGDGSQNLPSGTIHAAWNVLDRLDDKALFFDLDSAPDALHLEGTPAGGDSGGPVLALVEGEPLLIGVNSVGLGGPNGNERYGVGDRSVRVSAFSGWINNVLQGQAGPPTISFTGAPAAGGDEAGSRALAVQSVVGAAATFSFPEDQRGQGVKLLFEAINAPAMERTRHYLESYTDADFRQRNTPDSFHGLLERLQGIFGHLTPRQILVNQPQEMIVRFSGDGNSGDGVLELAFETQSSHRLSRLQAAQLD